MELVSAVAPKKHVQKQNTKKEKKKLAEIVQYLHQFQLGQLKAFHLKLAAYYTDINHSLHSNY